MKDYVRTLTIAGSDSGGCAGIQADLKTFAALGCFGMSAIVALTAQNTQGVFGVQAVDPALVAKQIDAVLSDIGVDAIKIGMLYDAERIERVCDTLKGCEAPIVLDPVMIATSGARLLSSDAIEVMKEKLFPMATVITPNLFEAEALVGYPVRDCMEKAAKELAMGGSAVLIKGGHLEKNKGEDCLACGDDVEWLRSPSIETENTHGSGCTLSSAIAAYLAKGKNLREAIVEAKKFMTQAIQKGKDYRLGSGPGPLNYFL